MSPNVILMETSHKESTLKFTPQVAPKYTQKYLIFKSTFFPLLYTQTLDTKGEMHATGPLKLCIHKTGSFIYFSNCLRPTVAWNDQLCL